VISNDVNRPSHFGARGGTSLRCVNGQRVEPALGPSVASFRTPYLKRLKASTPAGAKTRNATPFPSPPAAAGLRRDRPTRRCDASRHQSPFTSTHEDRGNPPFLVRNQIWQKLFFQIEVFFRWRNKSRSLESFPMSRRSRGSGSF
jgi:hypothetical protein